jgi:hypothetical protein
VTVRFLVGSGLAASTLLVGSPALAHGVGARGDLPVPLWWALYGAIAVLGFTFAFLARTWPEARLERPRGGVLLPDGLDRAALVARPVGRIVGFAILAVVVASAVNGGDLPAYALFIGVWVAVPFMAAVVGDAWSILNPFAAVAELIDTTGVGTVPPWLERAGHLPAAALLLGFGWLELAHPSAADPGVVLTFLLLYALILVVGGLRWGRSWIDQADAFGVYFGLVGRLGLFQRDDTGRLRLRAPLVGLTQVKPVRGTALVVLVALGVTSFDGLSRSSLWASVLDRRTGWEAVPLNSLGLFTMVGIVAGLYWASMRWISRVVDEPVPALAERFAHTLVPISLGYAVAHYFSLLVFDGQLFLAFASDPMHLGWDLFGTVNNSIDFTVMGTDTIALIQVVAIIAGHVAGVVLAHDRAVSRFPSEIANRSQHALFAAMVVYTCGGLVLLLGV